MKQPSLTAADKRWMAEADMRTLAEAQKIRADRGRLAAAGQVAKEQMKALKPIARTVKPTRRK